VAEPEKLGELLKKTFANPPWGKITAKRVVASLPEARVFNRVIELPVTADKDISEAVSFEAEQSIPVPVSDLYIDWEVIEQNAEKSVIFMSAAPRAIVDSYVHLFTQLGLEPLAVEISMAAIARSMVSNKEQSEPVIILDFGGQTTNLAIFDSTIRVTESHPIGGATIKAKLMEELGVKEEEATTLIRAGLKTDGKATAQIKEELEKIASEIQKMIAYYAEKNKERRISKVLLCGGLGYMPGLPELIKAKTGADSKLGNPWINISIYPIKPVPKEEAPGFAAAIGLSLRGFSND